MNLSRDDEDTLDALFLTTVFVKEEWSPWGFGAPSERTLLFERLGIIERAFGAPDKDGAVSAEMWRAKLTRAGAREAEESLRKRKPWIFAMGDSASSAGGG